MTQQKSSQSTIILKHVDTNQILMNNMWFHSRDSLCRNIITNHNFSVQNIRCHSNSIFSLDINKGSGKGSLRKQFVKLSQSKSKSKVERTWNDSILLCHPPPPTHKNFSQQPDIQLSSNFHSRLTWPRLNEFKFQFQNSILDCDKVESNSSLPFLSV